MKRVSFTDHILFAHEDVLAARLRALYAHYYSDFLRDNAIAKSWRTVAVHLAAMQRLVDEGDDNDDDDEGDASADASSNRRQLHRYASAISLFLERVAKFRQLSVRLQACWQAVKAERARTMCNRTRLELFSRSAQLFDQAQAEELQELVRKMADREGGGWGALLERMLEMDIAVDDNDEVCRLVARGKVTKSKVQPQEVQRRARAKNYQVCVKLLVNGRAVGWSPAVNLNWPTFSAPCGGARAGHDESDMFANNFLNAPASHGPSHIFRLKLEQRPKSVRLEVHHHRPFWWSERLGSVHVKVPMSDGRSGRGDAAQNHSRAAYSFVPETHDYVFASDEPMRAHQHEHDDHFFPQPQGDTAIDAENHSPLATWKVEPRCCGHVQVCAR